MVELAQYLASGMVVGAIYGLIAIGFTAVYNATGIVNFAQGDFSMLGALATIAALAAGVPLLAAIVLAVLAVGLLASVIERVAIRPVGADVLRGIIITIGVGVSLQGVAVIIWGTDAQPLRAFSGERSIGLAGVTIPPQALWVVGTAAVLMCALYVFLTRTYFGKAFRACALNPFAASLMGIPTARMRLASFFLSGLIGAALGGLLLGLLESLATGYLSSGYKNAIAFVVLLLFLFVRPGGILDPA